MIGNRKITMGLWGIIIIYFVIYFLILNLTFKSVENNFISISQAAQKGNWQQALNEIDEVKNIWESKKYLLMLNYAEADLMEFSSDLARIKGGIISEDVPSTVTSVEKAREAWSNFRTVVPEP